MRANSVIYDFISIIMVWKINSPINRYRILYISKGKWLTAAVIKLGITFLDSERNDKCIC